MTTHSLHEWPREYLEFLRLFNEGRYYEAHEVLEDLWAIEVPPLRDFYKGLIQLAGALHLHHRGSRDASLRLWKSSATYLRSYPDGCEGLAVGEILATMERYFEESPPGPVAGAATRHPQLELRHGPTPASR